jgi:hypothetical protein
VSRVKTVRITLFSFFFSIFFTRSSADGIDSRRLTTTAPVKVTAENAPNRAGATPLFCGRAAQKFRGVAPALVPFAPACIARSRGAIPRICQTTCLTFCKSKKGEARCPF